MYIYYVNILCTNRWDVISAKSTCVKWFHSKRNCELKQFRIFGYWIQCVGPTQQEDPRLGPKRSWNSDSDNAFLQISSSCGYGRNLNIAKSVNRPI